MRRVQGRPQSPWNYDMHSLQKGEHETIPEVSCKTNSVLLHRALKTLRCSARELGRCPTPYHGRRPWTLQGSSTLDPLGLRPSFTCDTFPLRESSSRDRAVPASSPLPADAGTSSYSYSFAHSREQSPSPTSPSSRQSQTQSKNTPAP